MLDFLKRQLGFDPVGDLRKEMQALGSPQERYESLRDFVNTHPKAGPQAREFFDVLDNPPAGVASGTMDNIRHGLADTFAHNEQFAELLRGQNGGLGITPDDLRDLLSSNDPVPLVNKTPAELMGNVMQASAQAAQAGVNFDPTKFPRLAEQFQKLDDTLETDPDNKAAIRQQGAQIKETLGQMGVKINLGPDPRVMIQMLLHNPDQFGIHMVEMMGLDPSQAPEMVELMQDFSRFMSNGPLGRIAVVAEHHYPELKGYIGTLADEFENAKLTGQPPQPAANPAGANPGANTPPPSGPQHTSLGVPGLGENPLQSNNIQVASAYGDGNDPVASTEDFRGEHGDFPASDIKLDGGRVLDKPYETAALGKDVAAPETPAADVTRDMQRQVTAGMNLTA